MIAMVDDTEYLVLRSDLKEIGRERTYVRGFYTYVRFPPVVAQYWMDQSVIQETNVPIPEQGPAPVIEYYVAPLTGSDGNNGTRENPFQSVSHAITLMLANSEVGRDTTIYLPDDRLITTLAAVTHVPVAVDLSVGSPSLGMPLAQSTHTLLASSMAVGSPTFGTPAVFFRFPVTANSLSVGSPSFGTPTVFVVYFSTANSLSVGSPALGAPLLHQTHDLVASGLVVGSPLFDAPYAQLYSTGGTPVGLLLALTKAS